MSILDEIDDVLINWHGSNDAMHWTAQPERKTTVTLTADTTRFREAMQTLQEAVSHITVSLAAAKPAIDRATQAFRTAAPLLAEPRPSALDARHHRRYRNRQGRR